MARCHTNFTHRSRRINHLTLTRVEIAFTTYDVNMNGHCHLSSPDSVFTEPCCYALLLLVCVFDSFFDVATHVERLLWQVVVLTIQDAFEACNGLRQGNVLTRCTSEDFCNEEWL